VVNTLAQRSQTLRSTDDITVLLFEIEEIWKNQNSIPLKNKTIHGITKIVSRTAPGKNDACVSVV
jgi:hypothetical protein